MLLKLKEEGGVRIYLFITSHPCWYFFFFFRAKRCLARPRGGAPLRLPISPVAAVFRGQGEEVTFGSFFPVAVSTIRCPLSRYTSALTRLPPPIFGGRESGTGVGEPGRGGEAPLGRTLPGRGGKGGWQISLTDCEGDPLLFFGRQGIQIFLMYLRGIPTSKFKCVKRCPRKPLNSRCFSLVPSGQG